MARGMGCHLGFVAGPVYCRNMLSIALLLGVAGAGEIEAQDFAPAPIAGHSVFEMRLGGGTTDLTLIQIEAQADAAPKLTRIGVGDHLMLGGDNMDLTLAHTVEKRLTTGDTKEDVIAHLAGSLAKWQLPDDVIFVDQLPHTATGKILKTKLRGEYKDYQLPTITK